MKIDMIVDLQYGSTGKGLLAGWLANINHYDGVFTCNMPNAGHTFIDGHGQKMIHKVLPNGVATPYFKKAMIGPGSVFSIDQLKKEIRNLEYLGYGDTFRVYIHESATVLSPRHRNQEEAALSGISSTMQGSAAAMVDKISRHKDKECLAIAHREILKNAYGAEVLSSDEWLYEIHGMNNILAEGCQGFSLGINQRFYPYCTSRECTPYRLASDMGLPNVPFNDVWGSLRTYPIRVGNTADGYSGDVYPDQQEITWEELGLEPELTTVTQRPRRVFTFSKQQIEDACFVCRPNKLFLNFVNYLEPIEAEAIGRKIIDECHTQGARLTAAGFGPTIDDIIMSGSGLTPNILSQAVAYRSSRQRADIS